MKASNEKADICQADISVFVTILSLNFHTHLSTHPPLKVLLPFSIHTTIKK